MPTDPTTLTDTSYDKRSTDSTLRPSIIHTKFLFDCDHLVTFCSKFEKCDITDKTDSILGIKLEDLEARWKKLQTDYETLMIDPESSNTKDLKENAKVNFEVCSEAYYATRAQIIDVLKISGYLVRQSISSQFLPPVSQNVHCSNTSKNHIKVPPCDTEIFNGGYEE